MTIYTGALPVVATIIGISVLAESADPGIRMFYAARLVGALLVATLVPLLIDRRLRR